MIIVKNMQFMGGSIQIVKVGSFYIGDGNEKVVKEVEIIFTLLDGEIADKKNV